MFKLAQKRKEQADVAEPAKRVGLRDQLLTKEFQEAVEKSPGTCQIEPSHPDCLHTFKLIIRPEEGYWKGGRFVFLVVVPEEYNFSPPKCTCQTKLWHPNITETGEVCLSILRDSPLGNGLCWLPTRTLKEVVWGINSLFTDLLNFDDPLNLAAAEMHARNPNEFSKRVSQYVSNYATERASGPDRSQVRTYHDRPSRPWDTWF